MDDQRPSEEQNIEELMHRIHMGDVKAALKDMHPADIAEALSEFSDENLSEIFKHIDSKKAGTVLDEMGPETQKDVIEAIDETKLAHIINDLPPDEQADIMGAVDIGIYAQTLALLMQEKGIGSCMQGALGQFPDPARKLLGIPEERSILFGMSFGYADESAPENKIDVGREPLEGAVQFFD